ncbi:MAG: S9 family peptidase, partial [Kordiimonadaceae bacterium]|nr:S9 family peptidase [Kordiimonadaceae bacterium]
MKYTLYIAGGLILFSGLTAAQGADEKFTATDIFQLEYATSPRIAPSGTSVVYERKSMDIMSDSQRTNIWSVDLDGTNHRPVLSGKAHYSMPRFSPDGTRMAYVSSVEGKTQLYVQWLDTGQTARVTDVQFSPSQLSWSPDGKTIAFMMFVPTKPASLYSLPKKPKGAKWAENAAVVDQVTYRSDGRPGLLPSGYSHVFVVPADGGTPRQITDGAFNHRGTIGWLSDSSSVIFSANLNENWRLNPIESDIYAANIVSGDLTRLTDRVGPDSSPQVSPDGSLIAYVGFDDRELSHQESQLYVMAVDGSDKRPLTPDLDRSIDDVQWAADGKGLYYSYDDAGKRLVAYASLSGGSRVISNKLGGESLGRPYTSGSFRAAPDGRMVFTQSSVARPADLAVVDRIGRTVQLTHLNDDLLGNKSMGTIEDMSIASSLDGRPIQAWMLKPAGYEAGMQYPLILEIHGGPHAAYGPHFSAEGQYYAAAGYMVLFVNPRGSSSYGEDYGNLIHHTYPAQDYNDLMDAVDATVA